MMKYLCGAKVLFRLFPMDQTLQKRVEDFASVVIVKFFGIETSLERKMLVPVSFHYLLATLINILKIVGGLILTYNFEVIT